MTAIGVIPARWQATRFPGKPLAPIAGAPMVRRVWEGARGAKSLQRIIVATEDARVVEACQSFGAEVAMTRADHETGTDRLAEIARSVDADVFVNIQGDEPLIEGWVIDAAVQALAEDPSVPMSTVVHPAEPEGLDDPNRVKVALDRKGLALYFSRSRIPALRDAKASPSYWQHVGLYAYRRSFLLDFVKLERTPLELAEALEQLRALEHGYRIRCGKVEGWLGIPVDVPADVARVEARLKEMGRC
jgi:3-deoxy-manno-octulosonate cytidylyltransferase (CMP-KDO synthetase)